jgi:rhodanese-related sulfurtransferase
VPKTVDELLTEARAGLRRLTPQAAWAAMGEGALLVDTRPLEQRQTQGEVPGALVVGRNDLEWRLDPASEHRLPEVTDHHRQVIVLCAHGYASSLAAGTLQNLGYARATDVVGGFEAWEQAGLPVERAAL